jgi:DNA-binding LacI/PurR family transcriptional regulator
MIWGPLIKDFPGHTFGCDNESGGYQATTHLIDIGRRNIAFIGSKSGRSPEHGARHAGYRRAQRDAGVACNEHLRFAADNSERQGYQATMRLLESGEPCDAIFAGTDLIAIGAMRALQDAGKRVPDDVSVVGFDDMPLAAYVSPALTTVQQNSELGAEGLVNGIVGLIKGKPVESSLMAPTLVVRESCGAAKR